MISYKSVKTIEGPLMYIKKTAHVGYGELVSFEDVNGLRLQGQVVGLQEDIAVVQLFSTANGFDVQDAEAVFAGSAMTMNLSPSMIGRVFDGFNRAIDGKPNLDDIAQLSHLPFVRKDINGSAINPFRRSEPHSFIETGISTIDVCNTIVKGQKIPIFSGDGLPDLRMLTSIAQHAKTNDPQEKFVVVVAGIGITEAQYQFVMDQMQQSDSLSRSIFYINKASDPVVERLLVPRLALTASEYLAYDLGYSVLTLLFDLSNYANALREVSIAKKEIPGRSGYPGYLYTDLANLLERAGAVHGKEGSITQIPILTMPEMDNTHVIPDLTGYITEGQITLNKNLHQQGVYPPVDILKSLSRLKDAGQKEKYTRDDHSDVSNQLFASVAEAQRQLELAMVIGKDSLDETGQKYIEFGERYQNEFVNQHGKSRSIIESLNIAWDLFALLPRVELKKLKNSLIEKYKPEILHQKS